MSRTTNWRAPAVLLSAALIYPLGYVPLFVEERYLYVVPPLLALVAGWVCARFLAAGLSWRIVAPAVVILGLSTAADPIRILRDSPRAEKGRGAALTAKTLAPCIPPGSSLASNREYERSLYLAYRLGCRYYGQRGDLTPEAALADLNRLGVDYYLVWSEDAAERPVMREYQEIAILEADDLIVYTPAVRTVQ